MIIQDINTIGTFKVELLCRNKRCWHVREKLKPKATLVDPVLIEESEEDEDVE